MKNFYENFANLAAKYIGLEKTDIETFTRSKTALFENNLNGAEPLKNYFSYRYYDPKTENFLLADSAAGFLLEICPLVGVNSSVVKNLNQFFAKELPAGGFLQFFLLASSDIEDFLASWANGRTSKDSILCRITQERQKYLRMQAANFHSSGKRLPREFKLFISYSTKHRNCNEAALDNLKIFRKTLLNKLASLGLQPRIGNVETLIRICREMFEFEPNVGANYKSHANLDTINNQCLSKGHSYQSKKQAFVNSKTNIAHRAFGINGMPSFWSLLQNINLLGDADRSPLPARFIISYTISNDIKTKRTFINRGNRIIESAGKPYSRHNKALHEEASEWREIIHRLSTEDNVLSDCWTLILSSKEEDIDNVCAEVVTQYSGQDWNLCSLDYFHLEAILGSMPMHGANFWHDLKQKKLVQPALSSEVVTKIPVHAEWYGVPISGVPFIGRRGQLFNWNPYYRVGAGNFNVNVVGPSGVGKSVFLQCLVDSMLASNVRVFILDIGGSYAPLAKLLNGEIIEFGSELSYTINPFVGLKEQINEEEFNQLVICAKELLMIMCGTENEFEAASLEKAIKDAVAYNNYKLSLKTFVEFLIKSESELLQRLAVSLYSYTPEGVFGKYFSDKKPANFNKSITIFEFEHIKAQPKLIAIILQTLLMQITSQFLTQDRSQPFMIVVDEAWMLMNFAAGFFAAFGRNLRRYQGSLVICTQCFADLQTAGISQDNNNHRKAIFENSAWKINLPPGSFADLKLIQNLKIKFNY